MTSTGGWAPVLGQPTSLQQFLFQRVPQVTRRGDIAGATDGTGHGRKETDRLTKFRCCRQPVQESTGAGRRRHGVDDTPGLPHRHDGWSAAPQLTSQLLSRPEPQRTRVVGGRIWVEHREKLVQQLSQAAQQSPNRLSAPIRPHRRKTEAPCRS